MKVVWNVTKVILLCGLFMIACIGLLSCEESSNPTDPVSDWSASCSCSSNLYNCDDFLSTRDAQLCYEHCINLGFGDIHDLDRDDDTNACEDWGY